MYTYIHYTTLTWVVNSTVLKIIVAKAYEYHQEPAKEVYILVLCKTHNIVKRTHYQQPPFSRGGKLVYTTCKCDFINDERVMSISRP
jgi:hypothetical protein